MNEGRRPYAEWLQHVLESDDIPYVITTSYGDIEATGQSLHCTVAIINTQSYGQSHPAMPGDYALASLN